MCRIVGILDYKNSLVENLGQIVISMRDSLSHGGPDDSGVFISDDKKCALGHRRLSIIDTSKAGHQPMSTPEKKVWIVYNGEIYNFQELKNELISLGYKFASKTDTEVLLYGYKEWGIEKLLEKLRGMFAFAIYDECGKPSKLILARDRFGIKPLYYYSDKERFVFASEVKAFLKSNIIPDETNKEALIKFLLLGSVPTPLTTIKNVFSLSCGHYMVVKENGIDIKQYWDLSSRFKVKNSISLDEAINSTRRLFFDSVKSHLISDVPLGVFLSGGVDSSAVVAAASSFMDTPLKTLSVVFDEEDFSEANYASSIAEKFKTDHREVLVRSQDFISEIPEIFSSMDQPTVDGVNTYFISKAAREAGLTVVLSGLGGDEVFLGYDYFKKARQLELPLQFFKILPKFIRKTSTDLLQSCFSNKALKKLEYLSFPSSENIYMAFRGLFTPGEIQKLLEISSAEIRKYTTEGTIKNGFYAKSLVDCLDYFDFKYYLQNQLLKDSDFMSMKHAIELRVPFLDHVLVEYIASVPLELKLSEKINKHLLVKALENKLPEEIWNRPKMGFTFPFSKWIKDNNEYFQSVMLEKSLFNIKAQKELWKDFSNGNVHWSRVWALLAMGKLNLRV